MNLTMGNSRFSLCTYLAPDGIHQGFGEIVVFWLTPPKQGRQYRSLNTHQHCCPTILTKHGGMYPEYPF